VIGCTASLPRGRCEQKYPAFCRDLSPKVTVSAILDRFDRHCYTCCPVATGCSWRSWQMKRAWQRVFLGGVITETTASPRQPSLEVESILAFCGAAALVLGAVLWSARGPYAEKTDFSLTYVGATIVHLEHGTQLYDLGEQRKVRDALFRNPNPLIYEHPPFEALALSPFARLPYRTAYLVWSLGNAAVWLTLPWLLRQYLIAPRETLGYLALWFLFAPLGVALYQGQSSLLLLLLFALTFIALKQGRDLNAGIYLALGLFKFQFVLPFATIFLIRRKWRFLVGFFLVAVALALLSFIAVGWQGVLSYAHLLLTAGSRPANESYGSAVDMPTLQGFVYAILGQRLGMNKLGFAVAALSILLIVFTGWKWKKEDEHNAGGAHNLMFAASIAVALMTGFHMFTHDFSPLILAGLLVMADFPRRNHPRLRIVLGVVLVLFWIPPVYFMLVGWHLLYLMFPLLLAFWFCALQTASLGWIPSGQRN
jgi:Glycosyltransferase family 87